MTIWCARGRSDQRDAAARLPELVRIPHPPPPAGHANLPQHRGAPGRSFPQAGARRPAFAHTRRHGGGSAEQRSAAPDGRARAIAVALAADGGRSLHRRHHLLHRQRRPSYAGGAREAGAHIEPSKDTAIAIPFIAGFVAWTVWRIRRKHTGSRKVSGKYARQMGYDVLPESGLRFFLPS